MIRSGLGETGRRSQVLTTETLQTGEKDPHPDSDGENITLFSSPSVTPRLSSSEEKEAPTETVVPNAFLRSPRAASVKSPPKAKGGRSEGLALLRSPRAPP